MLGNFAMYLRKSRADIEAEALGEGETLARHYHMLMELAKRHDILPSQITVYKEVVSGENIQDRPEVQKLLRDVYLKKYSGVLVVEVERLARGNTKDQGEVADAFQYSNTKIITITKIYDPSNEFDLEYFEFGLFMSRREYKTIRRRMQAGLMEAVSEGNYVGSRRPYGYDIQRVNKKERILIPNPEEAPYVKMMFNWLTVDGLTCGQIARKLTDMHIPTMTGNLEWNRATVKDIIGNIHYTGKVRWNRRKVSKELDEESGSFTKKKRRLTFDEYRVYQGKHEALITQEQYDLAQTFFQNAVPIHAKEIVSNPLAGIIYCKDCGKSIRLQKYPNRPTSPRYYHTKSVLCEKKSSVYADVIEAVCAGLEASISDFEMTIRNYDSQALADQNKAIVASLEKELSKQEQRRKRLFDAFEDGVYTNEEFIERKQSYAIRIEDIKKQIQEAKDSIPESVDYAEKIVQLHSLIETLRNPEVDAKIKNRFLKGIVARITYDVEDLGRNKGSIPILEIQLL